jgi:hypothetical protein
MKPAMFKLSDELADSENGGRYDPKKNGEPYTISDTTLAIRLLSGRDCPHASGA